MNDAETRATRANTGISEGSAIVRSKCTMCVCVCGGSLHPAGGMCRGRAPWPAVSPGACSWLRPSPQRPHSVTTRSPHSHPPDPSLPPTPCPRISLPIPDLPPSPMPAEPQALPHASLRQVTGGPARPPDFCDPGKCRCHGVVRPAHDHVLPRRTFALLSAGPLTGHSSSRERSAEQPERASGSGSNGGDFGGDEIHFCCAESGVPRALSA